MAEKIKVDSNIDLEENAPARVAFEMAKMILVQDTNRKNEANDFRKYFLDLYAECFRATKGYRRGYQHTEPKS